MPIDILLNWLMLAFVLLGIGAVVAAIVVSCRYGTRTGRKNPTHK